VALSFRRSLLRREEAGPSEDPGYLMVPEHEARRANGGYIRTIQNFASTIAKHRTIVTQGP